MSIPLTGTGGLFTRLGLILGVVNTLNTDRGTTIPGKIDTLAAQFNTTDQKERDNLYTNLASYQSSVGGLPAYLASMARSIVIDMCNEDQPQVDLTLATALTALIDQMRQSADTVQAATVGSSFAAAAGVTNIGAPAWVCSLKDGSGYALENVFAERVDITCIADAQSGGATAGEELFTLQGEYAITDRLAYNYPVGSGASASLVLVSGADYEVGGTGNWLYNSDFETWTVANIPDGWHIAVGSAGTTVFKDTTHELDGAACLKFLSNGAQLTAVYQELGVDTTVAAAPLDQLAVNIFLKVDSVPGFGAFEVALVDSTGSYIKDNLGVNNAYQFSLAGATTSYQAFTTVFRTPRVLPSSVRLQLRIITAITAGIGVYIDRVAMAELVSLYDGGPAVAGFSSATNPILDDEYVLTITNNRTVSSNGGFQFGFDRLFDMKSLGLLLPSSGTPTISDALIT